MAPGGIVTGEGKPAAKVLELRVMLAPPAGALPLSVTVPFEDTPPITFVGFRVTFEGTAGVTASVAAADVPL